MPSASLLRRTLLCPLGLCNTFRQGSDDTSVWGECTLCDKRTGRIDRAILRAHADRKLAAAAALAEAVPAPLVQTQAPLVERLRELNERFRCEHSGGETAPFLREAADRIDALETALADAERDSTDMMWQRRRADERAERLEEALRKYADPELYRAHPHGPHFDDRDKSWIARYALKEMESADGRNT